MRVGAVAALQHIKHAVTAARMVMQYTTHTLLAGIAATEFAVSMGLSPSNLTTHESTDIYKKWCEEHFIIGDLHAAYPGSPTNASQTFANTFNPITTADHTRQTTQHRISGGGA